MMDHICPVCGYEELYEPPYDARGCGSYEICPACGFQFGVDDDPEKEPAHRAWRLKWAKGGYPWFSSARKPPEGWTPEKPIARLRRFFALRGLEDRVMEFETSSATVELAAEAVHVIPARIAKTLSFHGGAEGSLLIVTAGDQKIDNPKFKAAFGMKAKMLSPEEARDSLGYEVGGVCPFDLPPSVKVFLDESLRRFDTVYPACGSPSSAVRLSCEELFALSDAGGWVDVSKGI
jgi:prolyl-tRNA editing enzyme YbaK/EbsC (Cys-tRNA(Pro) deacylase)